MKDKKESLQVEIPSRVVFLNIKDSKVFYDCSPQEARAAIKEIERFRKDGESISSLKAKADKIRKAIAEQGDTNSVENFIRDRVKLEDINYSMCAIEKENRIVDWLVIDALFFANLRMFGRSIMDFEDNRDLLSAGIFGKLWTMSILIDGTLEFGDFYMVSETLDGKTTEPYVVKSINQRS